MPNILVVDDNHGICRAIAEGLKRMDLSSINVDEAYNFQEAKRLAGLKTYDAICSDYELGDGVQLAQYIKNQGRGSPAFFLHTGTGYGTIRREHPEFERMLKDGAIAKYLEKPTPMKDIRGFICDALQRRSAGRKA